MVYFDCHEKRKKAVTYRDTSREISYFLVQSMTMTGTLINITAIIVGGQPWGFFWEASSTKK